MRVYRFIWILMMWVPCGFVAAQQPSQTRFSSLVPATEIGPYVSIPAPAVAGSFDEVIDRTVQREHEVVAQLSALRPMVETYVQRMNADLERNARPIDDQYFLRRLDLTSGPGAIAFVGPGESGKRHQDKLLTLFAQPLQPAGIARMLVLDNALYKKDYNFTFIRREFLGEVRCVVIDAQPKADAAPGRFAGRMWVEDQDYTIVRFNGTYSGHVANSPYVHFDSWRLNLQPGVWLPAYVYSEESDSDRGWGRVHMKAQTRLWGYDLSAAGKRDNQEFTRIMVDNKVARDQSGTSSDAAPVAAERMWEHQAEDNALERMEKVGLLAPAGDVDVVLQTVINNLVISNNLALASDVRTRVLITAPLESFAVGHTIVISRGLLDVLPDEASLAMVLAHELSHIVLGHPSDTELAFNDRILFPDERLFQQLDFKRSPADEDAADIRALDLRKKSPYKEALPSAALFLRALSEHAPQLPNLIRAHLGNSFAGASGSHMDALRATAPQVDDRRLDQIAALPLGGRIKLDPWSDRVEMVKAQLLTLTLAREKMPFEIAPFFPYLTRVSTDPAMKVASVSGTN